MRLRRFADFVIGDTGIPAGKISVVSGKSQDRSSVPEWNFPALRRRRRRKPRFTIRDNAPLQFKLTYDPIGRNLTNGHLRRSFSFLFPFFHFFFPSHQTFPINVGTFDADIA